MRNLKRYIIVLLVCVLALSSLSVVYAESSDASETKDYNIKELGLNFSLPGTWAGCTRTDFDPKFIKARFELDEDEWANYMDTNDWFFYSAVAGADSQPEIIITSYDYYREQIPYSEQYNWELELYAQKSMERTDNDFISYEVIEAKNTKFLVFTYEKLDRDGNMSYGKLYHTFEGGNAIDFDLSMYDKLTDDYVKVFDNAVINATFSGKSGDSDEFLTPRVKQNLTYIALVILAVAFVTVIVIYIVSKVKERKALNAAVQKMQEQQTDDTSDTDCTEPVETTPADAE